MSVDDSALLTIQDFRLVFDTNRGTVHALEGIELVVRRQECIALVGETGCGKSATALAMMGFIEPPGRVISGSICLGDRDILKMQPKELQELRGREIAFIFQEAKKALNPTVTVGAQLLEAVTAHRRMASKQARERARHALVQVGLADPDRVMNSYSFQLSGGMAQRVMIAIAIVGDAKLIIADEPTSALDVSIQSQVLSVMRNIRQETGSSLVLITHDLGVAAENCERIAVMYAGRVVEFGTVDEIFRNPAHPYTRRLLEALPAPGRDRLAAIPGSVPDLISAPPGCRFASRCERASDICRERRPPIEILAREHGVACYHPFRCEDALHGDEAYC